MPRKVISPWEYVIELPIVSDEYAKNLPKGAVLNTSDCEFTMWTVSLMYHRENMETQGQTKVGKLALVSGYFFLLPQNREPGFVGETCLHTNCNSWRLKSKKHSSGRDEIKPTSRVAFSTLKALFLLGIITHRQSRASELLLISMNAAQSRQEDKEEAIDEVTSNLESGVFTSKELRVLVKSFDDKKRRGDQLRREHGTAMNANTVVDDEDWDA